MLRHSRGQSDWQAQTQVVSKSVAVAVGQDTAYFRKTCYHSCNTDLVEESKRFWCFFKFWAVTFSGKLIEILFWSKVEAHSQHPVDAGLWMAFWHIFLFVTVLAASFGLQPELDQKQIFWDRYLRFKSAALHWIPLRTCKFVLIPYFYSGTDEW